MSTLLKNLMGNGSRDQELTEEMRSVLNEMRQERGHCEALVKSARASLTRVQELRAPMTQTANEMDALSKRLGGLEQRLAAFEQLAAQYQTLDERAERLNQSQRQAEARITRASDDTQRTRALVEELHQKVELALDLKKRLDAFLEVEKPFQQLRRDADQIRGDVTASSEQLVRMRDQHERVMESHKVAQSKMQAFDRRHEELGRRVHEQERRVTGIEQAVRGLSDVEQTVEDARRRLGTVRGVADAVAQKVSVLEAQQEKIERVIGRAEHLDQCMRQIDAGVRQQHENAAVLGALQQQLEALQGLSDSVMHRSGEIDGAQREADENLRQIRVELAAARGEVRKSVERFDFERTGLETASQRVADLRGALTDFEARFSALSEAGRVADELNGRIQSLAGQLQNATAELGRVEQEAERVPGLRRAIDEVANSVNDAADRVKRIEEVRPDVEAALVQVEQLRGAHALVTDALEQTRIASSEIGRVREEQSETRTWLAGVEQMLGELREGVSELQILAPTVEVVQTQAQRINESMSVIESRREFAEDLHRRLAELGSISARLDDRGRDLQTRLELAEQRFVGLAEHAAEAERLGTLMSGLTAGVADAERVSDTIAKRIASAEGRCDSVEGLAERMRAMREELEQRQHAIEEAGRDLQCASELRQETAASVQELDERLSRLAAALTSADGQANRVDALASQLEERSGGLRFVEKRLGQFEDRLVTFERMEQEITRSLDQLSARQGTVEALQAEVERMFAMAETTARDVREITSAHGDIEESRMLLDDVMERLREVRDTANALEQRKRQLSQAEERLGRAEALVMEIRAGLEVLSGQKAIVDHAVEKAATLRFLLKQAETMIEELREERDVAARVRAALSTPGEDEAADPSERLAVLPTSEDPAAQQAFDEAGDDVAPEDAEVLDVAEEEPVNEEMPIAS